MTTVNEPATTEAPQATEIITTTPVHLKPLWQQRHFIVLVAATALLFASSWAYISLSIDDGQVMITRNALSPELSQKLLDLRMGKIGPMIVVGFAVGIATIVFQTVTKNRILTPNIMGIDALFELIQTVLIFFLGAAAVAEIAPPLLFSLETVLLLGLASFLFYWVFIKAKRSLYSLALVGIITGIFFRSVSSLFQRLIDPQEYLIVRDRSMARFEIVEPSLFAATVAMCVVAIAIIWVFRYRLDLLTLGKYQSISLGLSYSPVVLTLLVCCAVLVSATTALVGPLTFLGLLVSNIAISLAATHKHAWLLPITGIIGAATLVTAQFVLERVMGMGTVVTVVIELAGGLLFLLTILKGIYR